MDMNVTSLKCLNPFLLQVKRGIVDQLENAAFFRTKVIKRYH